MSIESREDFEGLKEAGRIVRIALSEMEKAVRSGITTAELDEIGADVLMRYGARSAPMLVYGFPGAACISVNDEIVHGVPGGRVIQGCDLVKLDVTVEKDGYMADAAITVPVPPVSEERRELIACAKRAFDRAMTVTRAGFRVRDIGRAVEKEVRRSGFVVIRDGLAGHGIGRTIHEEPTVPNYYDFRARQRLTNGLVITVEPMIATGSGRALQAANGWTIKTADGSWAAHYEHTVVVTRGTPILLTAA